MVPYAVGQVENDAGQVVTQYKPESKGQIIEESLAKKINKMMQAVVSEGTAHSLQGLPCSVAGKTGSAEFDSEGTSHAWFIGFAPANNPQIAVSIVVEGAGTGSEYALPIARQMFEEYF